MIVRQLAAQSATLAVAESCTGGLLAHRLTNVPGASEVFLAGYVTYSNEAKSSALDVPARLIAEHGAVSEAVAAAMAAGAQKKSGATHALSTTGIAGRVVVASRSEPPTWCRRRRRRQSLGISFPDRSRPSNSSRARLRSIS